MPQSNFNFRWEKQKIDNDVEGKEIAGFQQSEMYLPISRNKNLKVWKTPGLFLLCLFDHWEMLGQSCHCWWIWLVRLFTPIARWAFNGKILCKVEYVSLMHDGTRLTNAGSETRSPRVICSDEIKPISLASIHLLHCLTPTRWCHLSLSCLQGCF